MSVPDSEIIRAERLARVESDVRNVTEKVTSIQSDLRTVQTDMREVRDTIREAWGGWRALVMFAGSGGVGAALTAAASKLWHIP